MAQPTCSDKEFISIWNKNPSSTPVARILGVAPQTVRERRRKIEQKYGIELKTGEVKTPHLTLPENRVRAKLDIENGTIFIGSDAHYWPGIISTAHRAAVSLAKDLQPGMICMNGDAFDGASNGRHARIMWESKPSVKQELEAVRDRLADFEAASPSSLFHWNFGNHDQRFDTKLSAQVPEYEGVPGFSLVDHFPRWKFSMSLMVNNHTMIKHRWHNGIHATYNNVLKSGTSMVTGHLHALQVRPYTDYNGTRYAVDTGTLAHPAGPQFVYAEDSPFNHRSGFAILTFHKGKLLPPELVEVVDEDEGLVFFRGQIISV